jgi:hypothetical protein
MGIRKQVFTRVLNDNDNDIDDNNDDDDDKSVGQRKRLHEKIT